MADAPLNPDREVPPGEDRLGELRRPGVKYCFLGETSGYPAAGGDFSIGFPPGQCPLVILEDETSSSSGKRY